MSENVNKTKDKYYQKIENLKIMDKINLQIVTLRTEIKADVCRQLFYKIENHSHFTINTELDFSKSENILTFEPSNDLIFRNQINPFTYSDLNENEEKQNIIQNAHNQLKSPIVNIKKNHTEFTDYKKNSIQILELNHSVSNTDDKKIFENVSERLQNEDQNTKSKNQDNDDPNTKSKNQENENALNIVENRLSLKDQEENKFEHHSKTEHKAKSYQFNKNEDDKSKIANNTDQKSEFKESKPIPGKLCDIQYLNEYNLHCKLKFEIKFPTFEKQLELISESQKLFEIQQLHSQKSLKSYNLEVIDEEQIFRIFYEKEIDDFIDPNYTEFLKEIEVETREDKKYKAKIAVHWRKLADLMSIKNLEDSKFNEDINPFNLAWGLKRINRVYCSFAFLSQYPCLIDRLFCLKSLELGKGIFKIKLFVNGMWEKIVLDDYIPCFPNSMPIFTYDLTYKNSWPMILEKGLAKYFGGYENLESISSENLIKFLTGFPVITHRLRDSNEDKLFSKLEDALNNEYLMFAYADRDIYDFNKNYFDFFESGYFYPISGVYKMNQSKMVFLRNIWKKSEKFDSDSQELLIGSPDKFSRESNYKKIKEKYIDESIMTLNQKEFFSFFNNIVICQMKNFYEAFFRSKFTRAQDILDSDVEAIISYNYYRIILTENSNMKILLSFDDEGFFDNRYFRDENDVSVGIMKKEGDHWTIIHVEDFKLTKQIFIEIPLGKGEYFIIPRTTGFSFRKNTQYTPDIPLFYNGKINQKYLNAIVKNVFINFDSNCLGLLKFNEIRNIMHRFNKNINLSDFDKYVKKYSSEADGIYCKGLQNLVKDICNHETESNIREYLKNLGFDRDLYPYLNRFYYIHFYSNKPFTSQLLNNLDLNLDMILNNILLENGICKEDSKEEVSILTVKNKNDKIMILGIRNDSKNIIKEVILDASQCSNIFISTFNPKISKIIKPGKVEFAMYLVSESFHPGNSEIIHSKVIHFQVSNISMLGKYK